MTYRTHWVGLALILVVAGGLRLHRLGATPLGVDELFSIHFATALGPWETALPQPGEVRNPAPRLASMESTGPVWAIPHALSRDTHPPLFSLLLRGWLAMVGDSDARARALSVLFSLAAIGLLFDAVRVLHGPGAGLWSAGIMALAGTQIEAAQEVRGYMLLTMLTAGAGATAARIAVSGASTRRCGAFAGLALAAMLTHYWAIAPLSAAFVFLMYELSGRERVRLIGWVLVSVGVFAVAWGPWMWQQRPYFSLNMQWLSAEDDPGHVGRTIRLAALTPLRLLFDPGNRILDQTESGQGWTWAFVALALLLPVLGLRINRGLRLWWLMLVMPIALVVWADLWQDRRTIGLVRYVLPAGVGLYAAMAAALWDSIGWKRYALPAAGVLACLFALPMAWERNKPDWKTLARETLRDAGPRDLLIVLPASRWAGAIAYMGVCRYAGAPPCPVAMVESPTDVPAVVAGRDVQRLIVLSDVLSPPIAEFFLDAPILRSGGVFAAGSWNLLEGSLAESPPVTGSPPGSGR